MACGGAAVWALKREREREGSESGEVDADATAVLRSFQRGGKG
jgi:hypothetical protein